MGRYIRREDYATFFLMRVDLATEVVRLISNSLVLANHDVACIDFSNKPLLAVFFELYNTVLVNNN